MTSRNRWISRSVSGLLLVLAAATCGDSSRTPTTPTPPPPDSTPSTLSLTLVYATYLGGSSFEEAREPIALSGNRLLFSARAFSSGMPTTAGAVQPSFGGGQGDSYLGILSSNGSTMEAATYFGGSGMERSAYGMAVTANGDIVFTAGTNSTNLATTPGAHRPQLNSPVDGGYVCRIAPTMTQVRWCTYIVGWPRGGLTLTPSEEVVVVGRVHNGAPFTATTGAYQSAQRGIDDAYVLRLSADGRSAVAETRIGGSGTDLGEEALSVNMIGNDIVLSGISQSPDFPTTANAFQRQSRGPRDVFVARMSGDGRQLLYGTIISGSADDGPAHRDAVAADNSLIIAGATSSTNLQGATGTLRGNSDGFVARMTPTGTFSFIRYYGGSGADRFIDRAVDSQGRILVVGETESRDFPVSPNALQTTFGGGTTDGVILLLDASGNVLYSTYFGGSGDDWIRGVAIGQGGAIFIVGATTSNNFPVTPGALQQQRGGAEDAFMARLTIGTAAP